MKTLITIFAILCIELWAVFQGFKVSDLSNELNKQRDSVESYRRAYILQKKVNDTIFSNYYLVNKSDIKLQKALHITILK